MQGKHTLKFKISLDFIVCQLKFQLSDPSCVFRVKQSYLMTTYFHYTFFSLKQRWWEVGEKKVFESHPAALTQTMEDGHNS